MSRWGPKVYETASAVTSEFTGLRAEGRTGRTRFAGLNVRRNDAETQRAAETSGRASPCDAGTMVPQFRSFVLSGSAGSRNPAEFRVDPPSRKFRIKVCCRGICGSVFWPTCDLRADAGSELMSRLRRSVPNRLRLVGGRVRAGRSCYVASLCQELHSVPRTRMLPRWRLPTLPVPPGLRRG